MPCYRAIVLAAAALSLSGSHAHAQGAPPQGWRWSFDRASGSSATDTSLSFVQMAPGWHITTRRGAVLFDPAERAAGRYAIESVQILFPGTTQSGYGLFIGGRNIGAATQDFVALLMRRDGHVRIEHHAGADVHPLTAWTPVAAVKQAEGQNTVSNTLRVTVDRDSLLVDVNGTRAVAMARGPMNLDGSFGFRTGDDLNLHITTLDILRRLAPVPAPAR